MKCFDERDVNVSVIINGPFISILGNAAAFLCVLTKTTEGFGPQRQAPFFGDW